MKQKMTWQTPGGVVTLEMDFRGAETHKECVERIEKVFEKGVEVIKSRAQAGAPDVKLWVPGKPRLKAQFSTVRIKAKGKNITSKTDRFGVVIGGGEYPDKPKSLPREHLAKGAHVDLGTKRTPKKKFTWKAFDRTKAEILGDLENCV